MLKHQRAFLKTPFLDNISSGGCFSQFQISSLKFC